VPTAGSDAAAGEVSVTVRRAGMVRAAPVVMAPVRAVSADLVPVDLGVLVRVVRAAPVVRAAMAVAHVPAVRAPKAAA